MCAWLHVPPPSPKLYIYWCSLLPLWSSLKCSLLGYGPHFAPNKTFMLFFFFFLSSHLQHIEVPRLGVKLEQQLMAYTPATAMQDPSHICNSLHSSRQRHSSTHWGGPGIEPSSSWILLRFITTKPQWELLPQIKLNSPLLFYLFICLFIFRAAPMVFGSFQAKGWIRAAAAGLHHRHSNTGSEPYLWPIPQRTAMPDP